MQNQLVQQEISLHVLQILILLCHLLWPINVLIIIIKGLTVSLQKKAKDSCQAYAEVKTVQAALNQVREKINVEHKAWFIL